MSDWVEDEWGLGEAFWKERATEWRARALAYEQALRDALLECENSKLAARHIMRGVEQIIRAALDKPGDIPQTPDVQCIPRPE